MEKVKSGEGITVRVEPQVTKKSAFYEFMESIIVAVLLAVVIRIFIIQPFFIPSGSMEPTLQVGDRIIVSKFNYHFWSPQRGDIIVFKYPLDPTRDFVKRLIAFGGETVTLKNSMLYINNQQVPEEYLPAGLYFNDFGPIIVPPGHYLALGDNRNNSDDSRVWGPLPQKYVVGKAILVYWPPQRIRLLTGK